MFCKFLFSIDAIHDLQFFILIGNDINDELQEIDGQIPCGPGRP